MRCGVFCLCLAKLLGRWDLVIIIAIFLHLQREKSTRELIPALVNIVLVCQG